MTREIKFRVRTATIILGWEALVDGEWHWCKKLKNGAEGKWRRGAFVGIPLERDQYTGIKDIANVEIYEDDIVGYDTEDGVWCAAVKWVTDIDPDRDVSPIFGPGFILEDATLHHNYAEGEDAFELLVVGNIYENPELLNGEAKTDEPAA